MNDVRRSRLFGTSRAPRFASLRIFFAALAVAALAGCLTTSGASRNALPLVKVQAQHDLDCPQSELRIEQQLGGRFKVVGCGHKAIYKTACDALNCVVRGEGEMEVPWHAPPEPGTIQP